SGTVLDSPPISVASLTSVAEAYPEVSWNGQTFLVLWHDDNDLRRVAYGARVFESGTVMAPGRFRIGGETAWRPCAAWGDDSHLGVWADSQAGIDSLSYRIAAARVSASGTVLGGGPFVIHRGNGIRKPRVAWNGSEYLVVWIRQLPNVTNGTVEAKRVAADGTLIDAAPILLCRVPGEKRTPDVASDGSEFLCVWIDDRGVTHEGFGNHDVYQTRVTAAGEVLTPGGVPIYVDPIREADEVTVACSGASYLTAWGAYWATSAYDILGSIIAPGGSVEDTGFPLSRSYDDQSAPAAAWLGGSYLIVYQEDGTASLSDVRATRLDPAGQLLDPNLS
ncbi:MAG: hypothetical protein QUU85_06775, partial [Candidatus Eisenbacteria bacterium]|nr:hypothetical protein [Candidatus Eisenbacteria bacterium]